MTPVLTATEGRTGWITLNRPEAMNAVTVELATALEAALAAHLADDTAGEGITAFTSRKG
jgi:enoyl-CoA hydratase